MSENSIDNGRSRRWDRKRFNKRNDSLIRAKNYRESIEKNPNF